MKALITGASSGMGADMARILASMGYDLVLVARRKNRLDRLKKELDVNVDVISMDLGSSFNCVKLYNDIKDSEIDIVINCAGFGAFGEFNKVNMDKELDMIDLNIKAVHILTKLFLNDFKKKNRGYILNVASSAGFMPGPLMATYYATKAYVLNLTMAINEELRKDNSNVYVGALCPGPVDTEFNKVAKVHFEVKPLDSYDVSKYAIKKMFRKKMIIIPGITIKCAIFLTRLVPRRLLLHVTYNIQKAKRS